VSGQRRRGGRTLVPGEARGRGGLILPGEGARRGQRTLHVPRGYETQEEVVLVGTCSTCDRIFHRGEEDEWQRHVGWCARQNLPDVLAAREARKSRLEVFSEEAWDPELARHFRRVGDRMLAERRLQMRPNERADG
jgi:hypothetical protein